MLQRKQSLWLFLAALLNTGLFFFDLYRYHTVVNGVDTLSALRVADNFPSLLLALIMTILPLITIFLFRNRKLQLRMCLYTVITFCLYMVVFNMRLDTLHKAIPAPTNCSYWIGSITPVAALVFVVLAVFGIRRDDKLVKSVDRLR